MDIVTTGHQMAMMPIAVNYTGHRIHHGMPQLNGYSQSASFENVQNVPNFGHHPNPNMPPIHPGMIHLRNPNIPNRTHIFQHPFNIHDRSHYPKQIQNGLNQHPNSHPNKNPSSTHHPFHRNDKTFGHRDGVDNGWGWGHGNGNGSVGNSPAISALALLGFLFFLNLIQTSLQNNRMMLTTTTTTTTTNMTSSATAGSSMTTTNGRSGRERQKRDSDYYSFHRYTPVSIPSHPIRPIQSFLENRENDQPQFQQPPRQTSSYPLDGTRGMKNNVIRSKQRNTVATRPQNSSVSVGLMKQIGGIWNSCLKLLGCNFGRSVIKKVGKPTALILRSMGSTMSIEELNE